jgi:hypothetical protein
MTLIQEVYLSPAVLGCSLVTHIVLKSSRALDEGALKGTQDARLTGAILSMEDNSIPWVYLDIQVIDAPPVTTPESSQDKAKVKLIDILW